MIDRLRSAFRAAVGAAFGTVQTFAEATRNQISVAPTYLQHLLWLLTQEFRELCAKGFGGNGAVYACLRLLSTSVPEPPLVAYLRQPDGQPGERLPWQHPLSALIRNPNQLLTEYEFHELVTLQLAMVGRSHWWIERNNVGQPIGLWPLRPDRIGPIYGNASIGEPPVVGWSYLVPGTTHYIPIAYSEVMTFHFPDPGGESGGLGEGFGPLQALATEIGADNEATRYVGTLLANYATPGVVLTVKDRIPNEAEARLIKQNFVQDFGGNRKGLPALLDEGATVTALGFNLTELEFPQLRNISESRIAAAMGVPAILAGLYVGLNSGIRATIAEQREYFAETTLANYWRRFSDQWTSSIAVAFGADIVCRFDLSKVRSLVAQTTEDLEKIATAYQNGAITVNEYREVLGYVPREDGDVYAYGIAGGSGIVQPTAAAPTELQGLPSDGYDTEIPTTSNGKKPMAPVAPKQETTTTRSAMAELQGIPYRELEELARWKDQSLRAVKNKTPMRSFEARAVSAIDYWSIAAGLAKARTEEDVTEVFEKAATAIKAGEPFLELVA